MRTRGAVSHAFVTLQELMNKFQPNALIMVSRRFAEQNHLNCHNVKATNETYQASGVQPVTEEVIPLTEVTE